MSDIAVPQRTKELKGWHVLLWILGFFGLMFAVNGVFLFNAITSFPGEDVKKSYMQGLNYNDTLAARAAQKALGWEAAIGVESDQLLVAMYDATGAPLSNLKVEGTIGRRSTTKDDAALSFAPIGEGMYAVSVESLGRGLWGVDIVATRFDDEAVKFEATQSLILK